LKASDVITQLHANLPIHTSLFSVLLDIDTVTFLSGTVTVTTNTSHNLNTNDTVQVSGALSANPISSLTSLDGVATAVTTLDHHLTADVIGGPQDPVDISGASDAEYNGTPTRLTVPNRQTFTYEIDTGAPVSTTGGQLNEPVNFGYNGLQQITVVDSTSFTYPVTATLGSPASGTIVISSKNRISGGFIE